jgi:hypothetical protein
METCVAILNYKFVTDRHVRRLGFGPLPDLGKYIPVSCVMIKPQPNDYTTRFIKSGEIRSDVISDFLSVNEGKIQKLHPDLIDLEMGEVNKVGPLSVKLPISYRTAAINAYLRPTLFAPDEKIFLQAVERVAKVLPTQGRLRPVNLESVYQSSDKTTNWGAPYFTPGTVSGELHLAIAKSYINSPAIPYDPSICGWRGQPGGAIPKQRLVWMYAHYMVLIELTYLRPLLNIIKEFSEFSMLKSFAAVESVITTMLNAAKRWGCRVCGIDYTQFDASIDLRFIRTVFFLIKRCYQVMYHKCLDMICEYFTKSSLLVGTRLYTRSGGVPSGSGLTNLVDSIVHVIAFHYYRIYYCILDKCASCTVMGDDGVYLLPGVSPVMLSRIAFTLGLTIHPDKCTFGYDYVQYCQRLYHTYYRESDGVVRGIRSLVRSLGSAMSYERFPKDSSTLFDSCRWLTQLENSKNHPLFKELVEFAISRDSYHSLGYKIKGGPMSLFRAYGFEELLKSLGKGFRYTSELRDESDIPKLAIVRLIDKMNGITIAIQ